ncbi:ABC transporter substrate-binding protein [Polaromonas eurypsychrophila]|uniref:Branched-chain amino acid ABC transporter substrate-binding protein n=1 Tax=Polaromonas eurypsychrophila TaxID=1614635 RepID=A0A916SR10_9BURK|nr:ABC transporter substrate-binding protein [Polaromonas eurypsychrophila]GGB12538.1 branched-chain amino acid ABC transporter substrate-binding protein [Polaromonas eurypsychrophila]
MKHTRIAFAATLALLLGTAQADINIGISLPLTGPTSALGIPIKNAIALWPTTIAGEKLNVIILDDATDPTNATKNARRFVTDDKVDILMGSAATPPANAVAAVAAETGTMHMTFAPIDVSTNKAPWSYNTPQSTLVMSHAIVAHMKKIGVKTVGFIGYADAYGELFLRDMKVKMAGTDIKFVSEERFARTDTSVTGQALKVTAGAPDAILVVASGSGAAMPHKALIERGYKGKIYQTHGAASRDLMRVGGKDVEGAFVVAGPGVVAEQLPANHPSKQVAMTHVTAWEKLYGANSRNPFAGHAYDASVILQKIIPIALKTAKPGTKEFRGALKAALENAGPIPLFHGTVNYTATNHAGYTDDTGIIMQIVNGDWKLQAR